MQWIAPTEKNAANETLEKRLWDAADQLRANSGLIAAQYSQPVLGLIFLRFAESRFQKRRKSLEKSAASSRRGSRVDDVSAYHAEGALYLAPEARFDDLLAYPVNAGAVASHWGKQSMTPCMPSNATILSLRAFAQRPTKFSMRVL